MATHSLDDIFYTALGFHHYANTAYPLTPYSLRQYEVHGSDEQRKLIESNIKKQKKLNLYVHPTITVKHLPTSMTGMQKA